MDAPLPPHNLLLHPADVRTPQLSTSLTNHGPGTRDWLKRWQKKKRSKDPKQNKSDLHANANTVSTSFFLRT